VKLAVLIPTYRRPDRLCEVLSELLGLSSKVNKELRIIISVNDGCSESTNICHNFSGRFAVDFEYYTQDKLLTYDEQILFLYEKVLVGEYIWFCGDKYDYSQVDIQTITLFLRKKHDFYVFQGRFYEISTIESLPYKRINVPSGVWEPGLSNYFPQATMMSSVIFRKRLDIYLETPIHKVRNFMQLYIFLLNTSPGGSFESLPFDFDSNRGGRVFKANWNESHGLESLIWINDNFGQPFGKSLLFKASLMRGMKKNGFFRYWMSQRPISEKMEIYVSLIRAEKVNALLPINSIYIILKKKVLNCLRQI
jgi:hypothetical protein